MPAYKKKGTLGERLAVLEFLRTICIPEGEGYARYQEGWTDAAVARKFKHILSPGVVVKLRREYIGKDKTQSERVMRGALAAHKALETELLTPQERALDGIRIVREANPDAVSQRLDHIEAKVDAILNAFQITVTK